MRRLLLALALLVPALPGHATAPYDWSVVTVTAGPAGAGNVAVHLSATGTTNADPYVLGDAASLDGRPLYVEAYNVGFGGNRITTTTEVGSVDIEVTPGRAGVNNGGIEAYLFVGVLAPNQTYSMLLFGTSVFRDEPALTWSAGSGSVTVTVTNGAGTTAILAGDPRDHGAAADLAGTGAGAQVATRTVGTGIVGTGVTHCEGCHASWAAPDGRTGDMVLTPPQLNLVRPVPSAVEQVGFESGFAGPAGEWTFGWQGVDAATAVPAATRPVEIVYVPVGDLWPLFARDYTSADPRPSGACDEGGTVSEEQVLTTHQRVTAVHRSAKETDVCVRVSEDLTGTSAGGEVVVDPASPSVRSDGSPAVDESVVLAQTRH